MPDIDDSKRAIDAFFGDTFPPKEENNKGLDQLCCDIDQTIPSIEVDD